MRTGFLRATTTTTVEVGRRKKETPTKTTRKQIPRLVKRTKMVSWRGKRRIRRGGRITIDARDGSRNSTQKSSRVGLKSEKS